MMPSEHEEPATAVIALGGNALAPASARSSIHDQFRHTRAALGPIVDLALDGWNLCIVHGNGPQVGDELVRNELARGEVTSNPLGVLVAATALMATVSVALTVVAGPLYGLTDRAAADLLERTPYREAVYGPGPASSAEDVP